jgi:uncharacterized protein YdcH (DUF465 family)
MTTKEKILFIADVIAKNADFITDSDLDKLNEIKKKNSEFYKLSETSNLIDKYIELAKKAQQELSENNIGIYSTDFWKYFIDIERMKIQNKIQYILKKKRLAEEKKLQIEESLAANDWAEDWLKENEITKPKILEIDDIVSIKSELIKRSKSDKPFYVDRYRVIDIIDNNEVTLVLIKRPTDEEQKIKISIHKIDDLVIVKKNLETRNFEKEIESLNMIDWDDENEEENSEDVTNINW